MIEYENRVFHSLFDRGEGATVHDLRLVNCNFVWCGLSLTRQIEQRATVRHVELVNCRANECGIGPAILEDVIVNNLQIDDLLILWGTLFHRVTIRGRIGKIKINQEVHATDWSEATQAPFDRFRGEFYDSIDWALDICGARFKEFGIRGVPAGLIRRDPESQVVVTRERALQRDWRDRLSKDNRLWPFAIDMFLSDGDEDVVLVAPLDAPKRKRDTLLRQLQELRDVGVALLD